MTSEEIIKEYEKTKTLYEHKYMNNYFLQIVRPNICILSEYAGSYHRIPFRKRGWYTNELLKHLREVRKIMPYVWLTKTFLNDMDYLIDFLEAVKKKGTYHE